MRMNQHEKSRRVAREIRRKSRSSGVNVEVRDETFLLALAMGRSLVILTRMEGKALME